MKKYGDSSSEEEESEEENSDKNEKPIARKRDTKYDEKK